jgi:hypothetical protein
MFYFKDATDAVYAYAKAESAGAGLTAITQEQADTLRGFPSALVQARVAKINGVPSINGNVPGLQDDYAAANAADITYTTAGGIVKAFQADPGSVRVIQESLAGCSLAQATPDGFFWVSSDNTHVPFSYADLQGLAATVFARGAANFARLQVAKAAVAAATTVEEVNVVTF